MTAAAWPIQTAIYARLTGDPALAALVSGVYDKVPPAAAFPYVTVGESTETPADAHDRRGADATVTIHIWSDYGGYREALAVLTECDRLLDQRGTAAPLPLDGYTRVFTTRESYQTLRDPDPAIRHVPATYRTTAEEA